MESDNLDGGYTHDSIDNTATVVGWRPILTAFSDRSIPKDTTTSGFIDNKSVHRRVTIMESAKGNGANCTSYAFRTVYCW